MESGRKAVAAHPPTRVTLQEQSNTPEPASAPPAGVVLQLFTRVSDPADADERDAEEAASTAGRGGNARVHLHRRSTGGPRARLARKCAACTSGATGSCCSGEDEKSVQRRADSTALSRDVSWPQARGPPEAGDLAQHTPAALSAVNNGGTPLPPDTRASAETLFGADFSAVRIHDDPAADHAASLMRAQAYTAGPDIAFAAGKFDPATAQGRHLLHHELGHVVQQGAAPDVTPASARGPPNMGAVIHRAPDESPSVWSYVTSAIGSVQQGATSTYETGKAGLRALMAQYAPGVLEFIETDHIGKFRNWLKAETDGKFAPLKKLLTCGQVRAPETQASPGGESTCTAIANSATGVLRGINRYYLMPQLECGKALLSAAGWALNSAWDSAVAPALDAIKKSEKWKEITEAADWVWQHTAELRKSTFTAIVAPYFPWLFIPEGARDWLTKKAVEAWDAHKSDVAPYMPALKQVSEVLLTMTGFAPMIAAYESGSALWPSLVWLVDNWTSGEIIVKARDQLETVVIPSIIGGVGVVIQGMEAAAAAVDQKLTAVQSALDALAASLGDGLLALAASAAGWLAEQARELAAYLRAEIESIKASVNAFLHQAMEWALLILETVRQVSLVMANPLAPWIMTAGMIWQQIPDCLKGPIIDLILDLLAAVVAQGPPFEEFAEAWGVIAPQITTKIDEVRAMSVPDRVAFSNTVAKNLAAGGALEIVATAIRAAVRSPELFVGQVEKELMGTDLTKPLPFEKGCANLGGAGTGVTPAGSTMGGASITSQGAPGTASSTIAKLATQSLDESDVNVTELADLDIGPELFNELIANGGTMYFEGNPDAAAISNADLAELMRAGVFGSGGGDEFAALVGLTPEEQLAKLMAKPMPSPCGEGAKGPAPEGGGGEKKAPNRCLDMPDAQRIGPFTEAQRAQYVFSQMKKGVAAWWECNKSWLIPTIIASIVVLAALAIATEGAAIELLGQIMTIVGAIFLGWSLLRAGAWIALYGMHSIQGDRDAAAEALARAEAIVAIELIFILLFEGRGIVEGFTEGVESGLRATGKALTKPFTEAGAALAKIGKTSEKALANLAKNVGRAGETVARLAEDGKIFLKGLGERVGSGAKTSRALAAELRAKPTLFERFRMWVDELGIHLCGIFNPCKKCGKPRPLDAQEIAQQKGIGALFSQSRIQTLDNYLKNLPAKEQQYLAKYLVNMTENEKYALLNALERGNLRPTEVKGHLWGAMVEEMGHATRVKKGEISIMAPGKTSAKGPDFVTFDHATNKIVIWDGKHRISGRFPKDITTKQFKDWMAEVKKGVQDWLTANPTHPMAPRVQAALANNSFDTRIFGWTVGT